MRSSDADDAAVTAAGGWRAEGGGGGRGGRGGRGGGGRGAMKGFLLGVGDVGDVSILSFQVPPSLIGEPTGRLFRDPFGIFWDFFLGGGILLGYLSNGLLLTNSTNSNQFISDLSRSKFQENWPVICKLDSSVQLIPLKLFWCRL